MALTRRDVVCLRGMKATHRGAGCEAMRRGWRIWNGVAILTRTLSILTYRALPGNAPNEPVRYIKAPIVGLLVGCLYAANGNPRPRHQLGVRLGWIARLGSHARVPTGLLGAG